MRKNRFTFVKGILVIIGLTLLIVIISLISMNLGKMNISYDRVFQTLIGNGTKKEKLILFEFRLPRIVLGILVGIGMGSAGCVMQSLLRNSMASPGTLGISSGSGLFMLFYVVLFSYDGQSAIMLPVLAFIGGITAAGIIFLLSYKKNKLINSTSLILTGVAVSSGYSSLSMIITLMLNQHKIEFVQKWQAGDLWGTQWNYVLVLFIWNFIFLFYLVYKSRVLNVLTLGNNTATGLGVAVNKEFLGISLAAVALSSASVALGGNFFFVGMISPHIAKKLVGPDHKFSLIASGLMGALIVITADTLARNLGFLIGIPTGIIITIISIPYFLYLLVKSN